MIIHWMMRVTRRILAGESNTWSSTTTRCCRRCPRGTARGRRAWRRRRRRSWRRCTNSCWPAVKPWTPPRSWLKRRRRSTALRTRGSSWRCWRRFHFSSHILRNPPIIGHHEGKYTIEYQYKFMPFLSLPFLLSTAGDAYSEKVFMVLSSAVSVSVTLIGSVLLILNCVHLQMYLTLL